MRSCERCSAGDSKKRDDAEGAFREYRGGHSGGCGRCGNCKGERVRHYRQLGLTTVLVGDGYSDRCGARAADHVLARGALLDWCRGEGLEAHPFADFSGVAAWARETAVIATRIPQS